MHKAPTFCCGDYAFSIEGDQTLARTLAVAFADLYCARTTSVKRWVITVEDDHVTLTIDGTEVFSGVSSAMTPAQAVSWLTREVLDHEPDLLHFHATAVVNDGSAMVVAGPSGSGKSTLCTALVRSGWAYVSDEIVSVEPISLQVSSFPKPISVKRHAIPTVERLAKVRAPEDQTAPWMVPASRVGLLAPPQPYDVRTVALYMYEPDQPTTIVPLHRATLVRELLADGQDSERMGTHSLMVAARLAVRANCLRVSSSDALDVAESLRRTHGEQRNEGSLLELEPVESEGAGPRRAEQTSSVLLDGRALIFEAEAARIVELDEVTSIWWALFDGTPFDPLTHEYAEQFGMTSKEAHELGQAARDQLQELDLLAV